jgi:hypothetical protein
MAGEPRFADAAESDGWPTNLLRKIRIALKLVRCTNLFLLTSRLPAALPAALAQRTAGKVKVLGVNAAQAVEKSQSGRENPTKSKIIQSAGADVLARNGNGPRKPKSTGAKLRARALA